MDQKLEYNQDLFLTDSAKVGYVSIRLGGKAYRYILPRLKTDAPNRYRNQYEILSDLQAIYNDPDRIKKARRRYESLFQGDQLFSEFFSDFMQCAGELNYSY